MPESLLHSLLYFLSINDDFAKQRDATAKALKAQLAGNMTLSLSVLASDSLADLDSRQYVSPRALRIFFS